MAKILKENGEVKRGWIGVFTERRCARGKETFSKGGPGVLVTEVFKDGPAFKEGVKAGDGIIEFEGKKVRNDLEFRKMISISPIGSKVKLLLLRNGEKIERQITVESSKNMPVFRRCPNRSI